MHKHVWKTAGIKRLFRRKSHNKDAFKPKANKLKQEMRHAPSEVREEQPRSGNKRSKRLSISSRLEKKTNYLPVRRASAKHKERGSAGGQWGDMDGLAAHRQ